MLFYQSNCRSHLFFNHNYILIEIYRIIDIFHIYGFNICIVIMSFAQSLLSIFIMRFNWRLVIIVIFWTLESNLTPLTCPFDLAYALLTDSFWYLVDRRCFTDCTISIFTVIWLYWQSFWWLMTVNRTSANCSIDLVLKTVTPIPLFNFIRH